MSKRKSKELEEADEIAEEQKPVLPSKQEKQALTGYCSLALKVKEEEEAAKKELKTVKPKLKQLRLDVLEDLRKEEVVAIPLSIREAAEKAGFEKIPAFLRLTRNNKDLSITPVIVSEVIREISDHDILESKTEGPHALVEAILCGVRRQVRSFTEQAKLTDSVPRGKKASDIPFAPEHLSEKTLELHKLSSFVLGRERKKRDNISQFKEDLGEKEVHVQKYFERGGLSSQRVVMHDIPYNLCNRTREKKTKITFKVLQSALEDSLKECILKKKAGALSKHDIAACICDHKKELEEFVNERLMNMPAEKIEKISLVKIKT